MRIHLILRVRLHVRLRTVVAFQARLLTLTALLVGPARAQPAAPYAGADLTAAQADSIGRRLPVFRHWQENRGPWPRVRLYQFVDATPEQCAAVLSDYEHQPAYLTDLRSARIVARRGPTRTDVAFHYNVRFAPDVRYTVRDELQRIGPDGYAVSWTLIESPSVSVAEGSAQFVPWVNPVNGVRGTLFTYEHLVVPRSKLAKLVPDRMALHEAQKAARAIAGQVERERTQEPDRLGRQIANLKAALGQ